MNSARISIVIPVRNDPEGLSSTLGSLARQAEIASRDYEVIVIDNDSNDATPEVIRRHIENYPVRIVSFIESAASGSYGARNLGIEKAQAPVLAFLDADVTVPTDYVAKVLGYFDHDPGLEYLGCRVDVYPSSSRLASKYDAIHAFPVEKYFQLYRFVPTCCLTLRRSLLDRTGLFESCLESGGDTEFAVRAEAAGAKKHFARDLTVRHPARRNYLELIRKRARLGRGAAQLHSLAPARFSSKSISFAEHLVPSNPLRILRDARERGIPLSFIEAMRMGPMKLPLTWAHLLAFTKESRRAPRKARREKGYS